MDYVEGFALYGKPIKGSSYFVNKVLKIKLDNKEDDNLEFQENTVIIKNEEWQYQALAVDKNIFFITVHMLAKEVPQYINYIIDFENHLVTKADCKITTIEKGSSLLSDTTNLVEREIIFGYLGENDPVKRHHYTHELCDWILETAGTPGNVIRYYIHSDTKISYYQKEWPLYGNPIDKDGLGMGEAAFLKIRDDIYVITFTKHSHGNQPFIVWNSQTEYFVANFAGVSRQSLKKFVTTAKGYMRKVF